MIIALILSGGAGVRAGTEIICILMDDDRMSDDILRIEPVRIYRHPCSSVIAKQRRQVAGMRRMRGILRIIVTAGRSKFPFRILRAGAAGMDVEAVESWIAAY